MGCWNGTCGISNLPILSGEKVVLFVLKHSEFAKHKGGGIVYPSDNYEPITIPLFGEYNDYGGIENITRNSEIVYSHLMDIDLINKEDDKAPSNTEELINDFIERGKYEDIGLMFIRLDIYNALIKESSSVHRRLKNLALDYMESEDYLHRFSDCFPTSRYLYLTLLEDVRVKKNMDLAESLISIPLMEITLSQLRKSWRIQAGAGSQSEDVHLHQVLAKQILATSEILLENKRLSEEGW